jgi:hypothetical protein
MSEFIERVRMLEIDHEPNGWPAIQMRKLSAAANEIERLQAEVAMLRSALDAAAKSVLFDAGYYKQQIALLREALENCRLLAARHRKEEWASHVLRFCNEAGVDANPMRAALAATEEKKS